MQMSHSKLFFFQMFLQPYCSPEIVFNGRTTQERVSKAAKENNLISTESYFSEIRKTRETQRRWLLSSYSLTFIEGMPECHIPIRLLGFARFVVWKGICCWARRSHPYFPLGENPEARSERSKLRLWQLQEPNLGVSQGIAGLNGILIIEFHWLGPAISWGWWLWGGPP